MIIIIIIFNVKNQENVGFMVSLLNDMKKKHKYWKKK